MMANGTNDHGMQILIEKIKAVKPSVKAYVI